MYLAIFIGYVTKGYCIIPESLFLIECERCDRKTGRGENIAQKARANVPLVLSDGTFDS